MIRSNRQTTKQPIFKFIGFIQTLANFYYYYSFSNAIIANRLIDQIAGTSQGEKPFNREKSSTIGACVIAEDKTNTHSTWAWLRQKNNHYSIITTITDDECYVLYFREKMNWLRYYSFKILLAYDHVL